jgi:hypothetical protein
MTGVWLLILLVVLGGWLLQKAILELQRRTFKLWRIRYSRDEKRLAYWLGIAIQFLIAALFLSWAVVLFLNGFMPK